MDLEVKWVFYVTSEYPQVEAVRNLDNFTKFISNSHSFPTKSGGTLQTALKVFVPT